MGKSKSSVPLVSHHVLVKELLQNDMRISVTLVGAGGTGSHMLDGLARLDITLQQLGHQGLHVTVFDQDIVEEHNVGRQNFGFTDLGENKAQALVANVNFRYDLDWSASHTRFMPPEVTAGQHGNFIITCVDDNATRNLIHERFRKGFINHAYKSVLDQRHESFFRTHYWMDIGNAKDYGQIVLGAHDLPDAVEVNWPGAGYPEEKTEEPTCSAVESLRMQDLFINQTMAAHALDMLWSLLRRGVIFKPIVYINIAQDRYAVRGAFKPMPDALATQEAKPSRKRTVRRTARA